MSRVAGPVRVAAPAKVNLHLEVGRLRPDGFHEIRTLYQAVDLADSVRVEVVRRGIHLDVAGPDPCPPEENLAWRAAAAFVRRVGLDVGVRIGLGKRIPAGAGLGGGSSDAAAVLRCLDHLTGAGLGPPVLRELGAGLGSDVPFFLGGSPTAWGRGRGERLEDVEPWPVAPLVLVLPPVHVSTADAYRSLGRPPAAKGGGGSAAGDAAGAAERGSPAEGDEAGSTSGALDGWDDVASGGRNDFEPVVAAAHPEVRASLEALRSAGARFARLSGSGAACFGGFADRAAAERAATQIETELGWPARAARTLERWPAVEVEGGAGGG